MKKTLLKVLASLCLSLLLALCVVFNENVKNYYYRDSIGQHVVRIYNMEQTSGGTGFHIQGDKGTYILTNRHICELADKQDNVLIEHNGATIPRKVIKRYAHHDLCLVEAVADHEGGIDIASSDSQGEDTIVIGHPGLRQLTVSHGEFIGTEEIEMASLVLTAEECKGSVIQDFLGLVCIEKFTTSAISNIIYGGNSGSPVVNKFGNVVGVVFAGNRNQVTDSYMVPLRYVKDFIKGL